APRRPTARCPWTRTLHTSLATPPASGSMRATSSPQCPSAFHPTGDIFAEFLTSLVRIALSESERPRITVIVARQDPWSTLHGERSPRRSSNSRRSGKIAALQWRRGGQSIRIVPEFDLVVDVTTGY